MTREEDFEVALDRAMAMRDLTYEEAGLHAPVCCVLRREGWERDQFVSHMLNATAAIS